MLRFSHLYIKLPTQIWFFYNTLTFYIDQARSLETKPKHKQNNKDRKETFKTQPKPKPKASKLQTHSEHNLEISTMVAGKHSSPTWASPSAHEALPRNADKHCPSAPWTEALEKLLMSNPLLLLFAHLMDPRPSWQHTPYSYINISQFIYMHSW